MIKKILKHYLFRNSPAEITFFVTSQCNFECKHCFYKNVHSNNELTLNEISKIINTIPKFLRLNISGGEPFLRKDLSEICILFSNKTSIITIPTNASLPEEMVKQTKNILLNSNILLHISLSLDGIGDLRDKIANRKNTFPKFEETLNRLKHLQKSFPNLKVGIITTQTPENEKELQSIYNYILKRKIDNFGFNMQRNKNNVLTTNLEIYKAFYNKVLDYPINLPFSKIIKLKKRLVYEQVYRSYIESYIDKCYSGNLRIVITEQGDVYPCETLMFDKSYSMGYFRDYYYNYDFKRLFNSVKAFSIRRRIFEERCFCPHECDLETNVLFNPKNAIRFLKALI